MIGKTLDHYELLEKVGAGGMGEVYKARDVRLDRVVAVKILPPQFSRDQERRQRFQREAKTISSLQHPNICTLHDLGHHEDVDYLVMEYIEGETLADRLGRGAMAPSEALRYGAEIADALDRAHKSGIIHRDLKPGNVMLTKSGVKLLDFGLAKLGDGAGNAAVAVTQAVTEGHTSAQPSTPPSGPLTAEGTILGTFQYMAPEQLEAGNTDPRTDIFALGAVLFEMVTGHRAFEGKSQASLIAAIMEREPPSISTVQPMTPPALDHVVRKCLAKDPDDRWQSASDVAGELRWISEADSKAGVPTPVARRRRSRERLAWIVAAGAAAVAVAFASLWIAGRPDPPRVARFEVPVPEGQRAERKPSVSPDGSTIVFGLQSPSGSEQLWARPIAGLEAFPIPGTENSEVAFWSPDSRYIGFFSGGKLRKVPLSGGPSQVLCDAPTGDTGDWNEDGVILFDGSFNDLVFRVPAGGGIAGAAVPRDSTDATTTFGWPVFLPDGRHFLLIGIESDGFELFLADLADQSKRSLGPIGSRVEYAPSGHLVYAMEHTLVARPFDARKGVFTGDPVPLVEDMFVNRFGSADFSVSREGTLVYRKASFMSERLVWLDREGREIEVVATDADHGEALLSPDGRLILSGMITAANADRDVWVLDPVRGTRTRITFEEGADRSPTWSPDGREFAYSMQGDVDGVQGAHVFRRSAAGVGDRTLVHSFPNYAIPLWWTEDGTLLLECWTDDGTRTDIWTIDLGSDADPVRVIASEFDEWDAMISPDGRWIAYCSDETERAEIYVRSWPTGDGKWQISTGGAEQPSWSDDGSRLYYVTLDRRFMTVEIDTQGGFRPGVPELVFELSWPRTAGREYDMTKDEQSFLWIQRPAAEDPAPFTVVLNWTEELVAR